jgi:hypothetical protein
VSVCSDKHVTTDETSLDVEVPSDSELLYEAWSVIANVGHNRGGWDAQDDVWLQAAKRWRSSFHARLNEQTLSIVEST